jgi:hypothetical protein
LFSKKEADMAALVAMEQLLWISAAASLRVWWWEREWKAACEWRLLVNAGGVDRGAPSSVEIEIIFLVRLLRDVSEVIVGLA